MGLARDTSRISSWPRVNGARRGRKMRRSQPEPYRSRILGLERRYNWNGAGARAIRHSTCIAALQLLDWLMAEHPGLGLPRPSPSPRGGILLTWRVGDRHLTIRVLSKDLS